MISAYDPYPRSIPCSAAKLCARSAERLATATTEAPGTWAKSGTSEEAIRPGPTMPQRTSGPASGLPSQLGQRDGQGDRNDEDLPVVVHAGEVDDHGGGPGQS